MEGTISISDTLTWYAAYGAGDAAVLLHPGGVDSRAWGPNLQTFADAFHVFTPDRRGHGRSPDVAGPISFGLLAGDTIGFIERVCSGAVHLVGCSDGAVVALMVAQQRPDLVKRLILVAGVFHRSGWPTALTSLDEPPPPFMADLYGQVSPDGQAHYPVVASKLAAMHRSEPSLTANDLAQVTARTLVILGDDDEVTLEHAVALYRALPSAELAVIPGTSHGLLHEKPELCNRIMLDFLRFDPVETLAPIRRH